MIKLSELNASDTGTDGLDFGRGDKSLGAE